MKARHVIGIWIVIAAIALSANSAQANPLSKAWQEFLGWSQNVIKRKKRVAELESADEGAIRLRRGNPSHSYDDAVKNGEIFPSIYTEEKPDPFDIPGISGIFTNQRAQDVLTTKDNIDPLLKMNAATRSVKKQGFILRGEEGTGKSTLVGNLDVILREQNSFILKVNPLDTRFKSAADFDSVIEAMSEIPEVQMAERLVFHFDDLKPFISGDHQQAVADFDSVVNALKRLETPDRKVSFAVEATDDTATAMAKQSRAYNTLREIPVDKIDEIDAQIGIVRANLALIDPKNEFTISDAKIARTVRWVRKYAPDKPAAATAIELIETAITEHRAFFDPRWAQHQLVDNISEALKADKLELDKRLQEARNLRGYHAAKLRRQLPQQIRIINQQIIDAEAEYKLLTEIRDQLIQKRARVKELETDPRLLNSSGDEAAALQKEYAELTAEIKQLNEDSLILSERRVATELSHMTNARVAEILKFSGRLNLEQFRQLLDETIIGQPKYKRAIMECAEKIINIQIGVQRLDPSKPMCAILVWGPPGTGKTDGLSLLRELLDDLYIVPGGEFTSAHHVTKLTGAPPSYVGFDLGGDMTKAILSNPRMALIIDELEKAHKDLTSLANGIADPGTLNDSRGIRVPVDQIFLGVTTNAAYKHIPEELRDTIELSELLKIFEREYPGLFKPEFINRFEGRIIYVGRTKGEESHLIIKKFLRKFNEDPIIQRYLLNVDISEDALWAISNKVDADEAGSARNLRDAITEQVDQPMRRVVNQINGAMPDNLDPEKLQKLVRQGQYIDKRTKKLVELDIEPGDGLVLDVDEAGEFFFRILPRIE